METLETDGNFAKSSADTGSAWAVREPVSTLIKPAAKMRLRINIFLRIGSVYYLSQEGERQAFDALP